MENHLYKTCEVLTKTRRNSQRSKKEMWLEQEVWYGGYVLHNKREERKLFRKTQDHLLMVLFVVCIQRFPNLLNDRRGTQPGFLSAHLAHAITFLGQIIFLEKLLQFQTDVLIRFTFFSLSFSFCPFLHIFSLPLFSLIFTVIVYKGHQFIDLGRQDGYRSSHQRATTLEK